MTSPISPRERIDRTGASDANAGQFSTGGCHHDTQHLLDACQRLGISALRIRRRLRLREHTAVVVHDPDCDFCAADINCTDHASSFLVRFLHHSGYFHSSYFHSTMAAS